MSQKGKVREVLKKEQQWPDHTNVQYVAMAQKLKELCWNTWRVTDVAVTGTVVKNVTKHSRQEERLGIT